MCRGDLDEKGPSVPIPCALECMYVKRNGAILAGLLVGCLSDCEHCDIIYLSLT